MDEKQLRRLIERVKDGKLSRRAFVGRMLALGITAPLASEMLAFSGAARAQEKERVPYKPTKRGGGGRAEGAVVAGRDAAQPAFRGRHQGPGRLAHLLRAARRLGRGRQPRPDPRGRDPEPRERRPLGRRHVGDLEAQARRQLARRQAVHRRRRASSTGNTPRDPATAATTIGSYKDVKVEKVDEPHRPGHASRSRRRSGPTPSSAAAA